MSLGSIISPMTFSLISAALCQLLANERDEQIKIAKSQGYTKKWINQMIDFTVYPDSFHFPDMSQMPCVFVYFNEIDFPEDMQDIYENQAIANLQVDYYTVGKTEYDRSKNILKTADKNASFRLDYLTAQIYKILCSEETNVYQGTNNLITNWKLKKWERIISPENDNTAASVLGGSFKFEVGFTESTYYAKTHTITELYTKLNIGDNYNSPIIKLY